MKRHTPEMRVAAFWSKVQFGPGCWTWQGTKDGCGYGMVSWGHNPKRTMHASRAAWELTFEPPRNNVLHRCDNPACVRPDHLYVGTQRENMKDAYARGRKAVVRAVGIRRPLCPRGHQRTTRPGSTRGFCRACAAQDARRRRRETADAL